VAILAVHSSDDTQQRLVLVTKAEAGEECTIKGLAGVRYVPLTTPGRQLQGGM
jgi:hypothetical protein